MKKEVRYERMRPEQIRAAREVRPVVYIPIGTLEWHGFHDPVGLDGLKAHALAIRCAQAGGGLVFPPLYYGESREDELIEVEEAGPKIAELMGLAFENFKPGYMRRSIAAQKQSYYELLLHLIAESGSLGFKVVVFVAGHYPLLEHGRRVIELDRKWRQVNGAAANDPLVMVVSDYELIEDKYSNMLDHAGFWETSLLMALEPDLVDLSRLPTDESELVGILGTKRPVREAGAEYGEEVVRLLAERINEEVSARLRSPGKYLQTQS